MKNNIFEWGFGAAEPNPISIPTKSGMLKKESKKDISSFSDIKCLADLERVSGEVIWQNFEKLAAFIFEENDFLVETNAVKTLKRRRRQYDVIARKNNWTLLVECKKWSGNRPRLSALKKAIVQHNERCDFYCALMGIDASPVMVTLVEEEIKTYEGVPIVPITKLDSFIREMALNGYEIAKYETAEI